MNFFGALITATIITVALMALSSIVHFIWGWPLVFLILLGWGYNSLDEDEKKKKAADERSAEES